MEIPGRRIREGDMGDYWPCQEGQEVEERSHGHVVWSGDSHQLRDSSSPLLLPLTALLLITKPLNVITSFGPAQASRIFQTHYTPLIKQMDGGNTEGILPARNHCRQFSQLLSGPHQHDTSLNYRLKDFHLKLRRKSGGCCLTLHCYESCCISDDIFSSIKH